MLGLRTDKMLGVNFVPGMTIFTVSTVLLFRRALTYIFSISEGELGLYIELRTMSISSPGREYPKLSMT